MKKSKLLLLGAAGLLMTSCSQEEVATPAGEADGYTVTVRLPADHSGTRALGDGLNAENLHVAVYDATNDNKLVTTAEATFNNSLETTVTLNLANGKTYNIAFFAQSTASQTGNAAYTFDAQNATITANYAAMTSAPNLADAYDCFFQLHNTGVVTSMSGGATVTLYRPVAQINWGTDDYGEATIKDDNAFGIDGQYVQTTMTTQAYTKYNMLENNVDFTSKSTVSLNWTAFAAPVGQTFPVDGYKYVAMQYVFAPKAASTVYDLALDISNALNTNVANVTNDIISVSAAPVQANYRTNIYGSLLTNPNVFKVVKEKNFNEPSNNIDLNQ